MDAERLIGRQQVQIAQLQEQIGTLMGVLRAIKEGEIPLDRVEISEDGTQLRWGATPPNGPAPMSLNRHQRRKVAAVGDNNGVDR